MMMSNLVKIENLEEIILEIRGLRVLVDSDIAQIYGTETRSINKAVANNPDKFPAGYIIGLTKTEKSELVENFHQFEKLKHSTVNPKALTEKGLCMLATILKSSVATQAAISITKPSPRFASYPGTSKSLQPYRTKARTRQIAEFN